MDAHSVMTITAAVCMGIVTALAIPLAHTQIDDHLDAAVADIAKSGRTYYVAPNGNDSHDGSVSRPWATIAHAARVVAVGATVHVAQGTYIGDIKVRNGGTQSSRITFISDVPGGAHVRGSGQAVWVVSGDATTIQGFDVMGARSTYYGIVTYGSYDVVQGNYVHNIPAPRCRGGGGAGILNLNYSAHDTDIIANVVHDIGNLSTTCHTIHGIYHANARGRIQNNIVYRSVGWGIHTWHAASAVTISNNLSFGNGAGGILVGDGDFPGGVSADYFIVTNNICMDNYGWGIVEQGAVGSHNQYVDNILYRNSSGTVATSHARPAGTINQDPGLVNYQIDGTGDYHLNQQSVAIDRGTSQGAPTVDCDGVTRPQGSAIDIGPYEHVKARRSTVSHPTN